LKQPVGAEHKSLLRFERVWVREANFLDLAAEHAPPSQEQLADVQINLEVKSEVNEASNRAFVTVRAVLAPPAQTQLFVTLAATVEGTFSLAPKGDPKTLHRFATVQAPVLLLPYLRQAISSLTVQTRLGNLIFPPLNMTSIIDKMRAESESNAVAEKG